MGISRFYKTNFKFVANRYEEWQGGRCISRGAISTEIVAEVYSNEIHFELDDIGNIKMLKSFDFEIYDENYCILPDRIQYSHPTSDFNPIVPIVCHLFSKGATIDYVRFAMTNPDRIVEFYGRIVQLGQPSLGKRSNQDSTTGVTAEKILRQLSGYGMLNADAVMERAVKLYNDNANGSTILQVKAIIESLKLFVKVYRLDEEEHEEEGRTSMLKPKILMFIALCNYKIDNINRAYCIAKQGLDAVDEAIENSVFTGVPRSMYGADTLEEIIRTIENGRYEDVEDEDDYYIIDPEEIDLARFEEIMGNQSFDASSRQFIHSVIKAYDDLRTNLMGAFLQGNQKAIQIVMMLQDFVCPVFYAWEYFGYGKMSDIWKEDLAVDTFEKFKSSDILSETRKAYNSISNGFFPFRAIDQDGGLCESTKMVLEVLIERLES